MSLLIPVVDHSFAPAATAQPRLPLKAVEVGGVSPCLLAFENLRDTKAKEQ